MVIMNTNVISSRLLHITVPIVSTHSSFEIIHSNVFELVF